MSSEILDLEHMGFNKQTSVPAPQLLFPLPSLLYLLSFMYLCMIPLLINLQVFGIALSLRFNLQMCCFGLSRTCVANVRTETYLILCFVWFRPSPFLLRGEVADFVCVCVCTGTRACVYY